MPTVSGRALAVVLLLATAACLVPGAAAVAGWTRPQSFGFDDDFDFEPGPRATIASDGTSAIAWQRATTHSLMLATGTASGRFGAPRVIDRAGAREWSLAARPGGGFVLAWAEVGGIFVAVRPSSGAAIAVRRVAAGSHRRVRVAADPLGGWVIASVYGKHGRPYVRVLSLGADGSRAAAVQSLGRGVFGLEGRPLQALAVDAGGRAVLAYQRQVEYYGSAGPSLFSIRRHGRAFSRPRAISANPSVIEPGAAAQAGVAPLISAMRAVQCGEAGCSGPPVAARVDRRGAPGGPFGPRIGFPARAFGPSAALTAGGAGVLVFHLKTASFPFDRNAPVSAVTISPRGRLGAMQTLSTRKGGEVAALPLDGGRVLALWSTTRGWQAALAGADGRFKPAASPPGRTPTLYHTIGFSNRDVQTAGRRAILTWQVRDRIKVTVGTF